jgi:hypothetical protein
MVGEGGGVYSWPVVSVSEWIGPAIVAEHNKSEGKTRSAWQAPFLNIVCQLMQYISIADPDSFDGIRIRLSKRPDP